MNEFNSELAPLLGLCDSGEPAKAAELAFKLSKIYADKGLLYAKLGGLFVQEAKLQGAKGANNESE